jgi:uncharacterized protein (DUF1684 family)
MTEIVLPAEAQPSPTARLGTISSLHDWRRRIADLYAAVRAMPSRDGWAHWRNVRDTLFATHVQSPLDMSRRARFEALDCFAYDPALRFAVSLDPASDRETIALELGKDGRMTLVPYALTRGLGQALGAELTLYWVEGYGGGVFLPFGDKTNGDETFPGGRYLLDTIKSADLGRSEDGRMILDFNFAYYPSCAYSAAWVCPLSPPENRLPVAVRAGERGMPG